MDPPSVQVRKRCSSNDGAARSWLHRTAEGVAEREVLVAPVGVDAEIKPSSVTVKISTPRMCMEAPSARPTVMWKRMAALSATGCTSSTSKGIASQAVERPLHEGPDGLPAHVGRRRIGVDLDGVGREERGVRVRIPEMTTPA